MLAACAGPRSMPPPQAAVSPPTAWHGKEATGDVDPNWWLAFGDPTLQRVVETALTNNVDVAIAATRVAEARADFNLSRAQRLPNIGASAEGGRSRSVNPGFGIPEIQTAGQGEVQAALDLDLFGKLAQASEAARGVMLSSEAAHDNVRLAVASSAASGYITLRALDARIIVLRETLAARKAELEIARRRAAAGYSSQLDLAQAQAEYEATVQLIPATELAIARQEDGLNLLLGENPQGIARGKGIDGLSAPSVPVSLPASLLRRRPDIAAAEFQLVATDHALDSARAAFMPDVRLTASGGLVGSTLVAASPIAIWALGGSILAPLFDSGRLQAQQDAAVARRDQAAFAYRKAALVAFREVEDGLAAVQHNAEQERSLIAQRDILARTLTLATNRYRAGYSPYLDQLDAQRSLLSVRLTLIQVHTDRLNSAVALYQASGGGWTGPTEQQRTIVSAAAPQP
ncbi:efflux transporter outer membrane subunit [Bradyrhizobium canariense]|nr:efflux transporter outer membrane subunit [Bradyrhizobium canariense]